MTSRNRTLRHGKLQSSNTARVAARDRIMPVLLDRLTDHEPLNKKEAAIRSSISHNELRRMVLRDLQWLFNCINAEVINDFSEYPLARASTVNYGIPPLAGKRMSDIEWDDIQKLLTRAILDFEPRILPEDLLVRCITDTGALDTHNILSIEIKGRLWCIPHPMDFLFRTDVDLENGHFDLKDIG